MGSSESKPDPVPGHFNIYVTNQIQDAKEIHVRLRGDKLQENEMYMRKLNEFSVEISGEGSAGQGGEKGAKEGGNGGLKVSNKHEEEKKTRQVYACLTQGGFTFLPPKTPYPFAVENIDRLMYISVHDGNRTWVCDFQVDPRIYGCVSVKENQHGCISVFPTNPEPDWLTVEHKSLSTLDISRLLTVCQTPNLQIWCCVCVAWKNLPLKWITQLDSNQLQSYAGGAEKDANATSFEFLSTSGYEWLKVQRGNPIPPNAVKTTTGWNNRPKESYIGRVSGKYACEITEIEGMINHFECRGHSDTTSGEILLLTK